jgi:16S rRNA processing protein RimM
MAVTEAKIHSGTVVASARDVLDRNAAEALRGSRIFVSRANFPAAQKDEYYWVDLIGLNVINREGVALGTVRELLSTGAQTVLVMEYEQDGKTQERMIPFVSVYIDDVDLPARRILVDWQADF